MQNNLEERALQSAVPGRGNSAAFLTVSAVFAVAAAQGKVAVLASMISAHSPEEKIHKAAAEQKETSHNHAQRLMNLFLTPPLGPLLSPPETFDADDVLLLPGGPHHGGRVAQDELRRGQVARRHQVTPALGTPRYPAGCVNTLL